MGEGPRDPLRALPGQGFKVVVIVHSDPLTARMERVIGWSEEREEIDETSTGMFRPLIADWWDYDDLRASPASFVVHLFHETDPEPSAEEIATMLGNYETEWRRRLEAERAKGARA